MRLLTLVCLSCLAMVPQVLAQVMPPPLPPAPADGIYDDTRALAEASRQKLAKEIQTFRERVGMDAWFAATTFLPEGQTLRSHARLLRQSWSGERPAVLLLYDRSKKQEMVTFSPIMWEVLPTAEIFHLRDKVRVLMADASKPPEQSLSESMSELIRGVSTLHTAETRTHQVFTHDYQRMLRFFSITLLVGTVITGIAGVLARRRDTQAARVCLMPAIQVPPRLGAPHGGGTSVAWTEPG